VSGIRKLVNLNSILQSVQAILANIQALVETTSTATHVLAKMDTLAKIVKSTLMNA
jgi:hypothetical protein